MILTIILYRLPRRNPIKLRPLPKVVLPFTIPLLPLNQSLGPRSNPADAATFFFSDLAFPLLTIFD
ncbi:hypothetical protein A3H89_01940 [Candidatus Amesbacteria bacterium RIFCSPLOWO2_02_FULL_48_11]|uniref:Uncharacterized protein n=2 Tax=Candidatus Amesiibacteriota TaxID=1752730 RepID=A0A1F4Z954_9BACT|nr:MAG: hypothetical protein A2V48_00105 [Candidatus Amesbacteria bacterium RBG_19FT_COMBO_48_16]OGC96113.1 MAG: hypothetical protein A3C34_00470 [Candidatus Amesbacteria bacterium RIFCSPHIGHO2_02_FULL_48_21]OGC97683.1 MAG: hypothetical protein A2W16_03505 [Candidatus Amesbacteria bacterium RBG_16_48_31]OGC99934.1 MAG: hypothetical protein A2702_00195 [Candidatus Amesbacteria bacterium RIFCSPHIGHO2_01_FULL_48_75]OGD02735.1 MAG: hypothetical protein A3E17_02915 [Candidatus Amesbacteria bacterium